MSYQSVELTRSLIDRFREEGLLGREEAGHILSMREEGAGLFYIERLVQEHKWNHAQIAQIIAECLNFPYMDLSIAHLATLSCNLLPERLIRAYRVLPLKGEHGQLLLAIAEPSQLIALEEVTFATNLSLRPVIVSWDKLIMLIERYLSHSQYNALSEFKFIHRGPNRDDEQVVDFVRQILLDAVAKKVSDVHIEPYKLSYRIRLRVDGILHHVAEFSVELANRMIARLKVMSKLDIAERRLPQDGRFGLKINDQLNVDCRINVCPTLSGEKAVIRILDASHISLNIDDLGFENMQKQLFEQAMRCPQGMILVTGPTGSGKTVTLYSILNQLNHVEKNICTVEDPVEIQLPGVNQLNVHPKINLSFPAALRAFLRQDPDIIMLGEIRDKETGEIAIKAAQTGHLVLSTLHTNSAAETITRLVTMDLPAYAIASTINLIIAQRLLRKLCAYCKHEFLPDPAKILSLGHTPSDQSLGRFFQPVGCEHCMNGYSGRIGVFEILPISSALSDCIVHASNPLALVEQASRIEMLTLREAALKKVFSGITSIEEMQRVI